MVGEYTKGAGDKMAAVIGHSAVPLDGRFTSVRTSETNLGNLICDIFRHNCRADCALLNSGTFRSVLVPCGPPGPATHVASALLTPQAAAAAAAPPPPCPLSTAPGQNRAGEVGWGSIAMTRRRLRRCRCCLWCLRRSDLLHEPGPITFQTLMQILPMVGVAPQRDARPPVPRPPSPSPSHMREGPRWARVTRA